MSLQKMLVSVSLLALVLGAATADDPVNCTTFSSNQIECCKQDACNFTRCQLTEGNTTENVTVCHAKSWNSTGTCNSDSFEDVCNATTTTTTTTVKSPTTTPSSTSTQAPDKCEALGTNETQCCNNTDCHLIECKDVDTGKTEPHKGCHMANANLTQWCVNGTDKNTCNAGTTEGPTTQKPASTPVTTMAPTDSCEAFASNASVCCDKAQLKCMYIVCQDKVTNNPHMGCHVNTTDTSTICTAETLLNICSSDVWTPKTVAEPSSALHGQHFDGASFIGGIVLCIGIVAIGFFGLKFYRTRADKNYHTL